MIEDHYELFGSSVEDRVEMSKSDLKTTLPHTSNKPPPALNIKDIGRFSFQDISLRSREPLPLLHTVNTDNQSFLVSLNRSVLETWIGKIKIWCILGA